MKEYLVYYWYKDKEKNEGYSNLYFESDVITSISIQNAVLEFIKKYDYKVLIIKNIICLSDL